MRFSRLERPGRIMKRVVRVLALEADGQLRLPKACTSLLTPAVPLRRLEQKKEISAARVRPWRSSPWSL